MNQRSPMQPGSVPGSTDEGIDLVIVEHGGVKEIFATLTPRGKDDLGALLSRLQGGLQVFDGQILEMRVFGSISDPTSCVLPVRRVFGPVDWPLTCLEGASCQGHPVAGVQVHAVAGCAVSTLRCDGRAVGRVFENEYARHCVLGNLRSPDPRRTPEQQTRDTMKQLVEGLASAGMDIHDLVRTWFFIVDILRWYPAFNQVRSDIYSAEGVFERFVPASTGIGAENGDGAALVASACAMLSKGEEVSVRSVPSPLQCPAVDYGSSFSRAAEVVMPDCRSLLISGTASIDSRGATVHVGDVDAQIEQTMEVVEAILESRGMDFRNVIRGNAYFRNPSEAVRLERPATRHGLPLSRVVVSQNDVCRDDLLFELEIEAADVEGGGTPPRPLV